MTIALLVIALMALGLVLLAIEVIAIPGFGLVGVLGGIAMVASCYIAWAFSGPGFGALSVAGGVVAAGLLFWLLPKTKAGKKMVLKTAHEGGAADPTLEQLLDCEGKVVSDLRPSGTARIDDRLVDVVTDGEYVESSARVRVLRVEGARVIVEEIGGQNDAT